LHQVLPDRKTNIGKIPETTKQSAKIFCNSLKISEILCGIVFAVGHDFVGGWDWTVRKNNAFSWVLDMSTNSIKKSTYYNNL